MEIILDYQRVRDIKGVSVFSYLLCVSCPTWLNLLKTYTEDDFMLEIVRGISLETQAKGFPLVNYLNYHFLAMVIMIWYANIIEICTI